MNNTINPKWIDVVDLMANKDKAKAIELFNDIFIENTRKINDEVSNRKPEEVNEIINRDQVRDYKKEITADEQNVDDLVKDETDEDDVKPTNKVKVEKVSSDIKKLQQEFEEIQNYKKNKVNESVEQVSESHIKEILKDALDEARLTADSIVENEEDTNGYAELEIFETQDEIGIVKFMEENKMGQRNEKANHILTVLFKDIIPSEHKLFETESMEAQSKVLKAFMDELKNYDVRGHMFQVG